jgi:hypothetical protein
MLRGVSLNYIRPHSQLLIGRFPGMVCKVSKALSVYARRVHFVAR